LENTGKTIDALSKVAKPVAIVTDVVRMGDAINKEGDLLGHLLYLFYSLNVRQQNT